MAYSAAKPKAVRVASRPTSRGPGDPLILVGTLWLIWGGTVVTILLFRLGSSLFDDSWEFYLQWSLQYGVVFTTSGILIGLGLVLNQMERESFVQIALLDEIADLLSVDEEPAEETAATSESAGEQRDHDS